MHLARGILFINFLATQNYLVNGHSICKWFKYQIFGLSWFPLLCFVFAFWWEDGLRIWFDDE